MPRTRETSSAIVGYPHIQPVGLEKVWKAPDGGCETERRGILRGPELFQRGSPASALQDSVHRAREKRRHLEPADARRRVVRRRRRPGRDPEGEDFQDELAERVGGDVGEETAGAQSGLRSPTQQGGEYSRENEDTSAQLGGFHETSSDVAECGGCKASICRSPAGREMRAGPGSRAYLVATSQRNLRLCRSSPRLPSAALPTPSESAQVDAPPVKCDPESATVTANAVQAVRSGKAPRFQSLVRSAPPRERGFSPRRFVRRSRAGRQRRPAEVSSGPLP